MTLILPPQYRNQQVNVTTRDGHVVVQFDKAYDTLVMSVADAATLANSIARAAKELHSKQPRDYSLNPSKKEIN